MKLIGLIITLAGVLALPKLSTGQTFHRGSHGFHSRPHGAPRGVVVIAPPVAVIAPSRFIISSAPLRHYRPWGGYRSPTVVYEVPYVPDVVVVPKAAPGAVGAESARYESSVGDHRTRTAGQLAPFDPTPQEIVERMLDLAALRSGDLLYDLGAGDGRVVIAAAKKYGVKAVGFEIDPGLVKLARENVVKQGVEKLVEIRQQDFLSADLSPASVVTLYLSYDGNLAVRSRLMDQLKAGARVVSYTFDMGDWPAKIAQTYRDSGGNIHMIYLWQMGEPLAFR